MSEMSFLDHLTELRRRFIFCFWGLVIAFAIVFSFTEEIFHALTQPLCEAFKNENCQLQALGVAEAFYVYMKTGILAALFLSAPWIFYQLWAFVSPGLHQNERRLVIPFVLCSALLFVGGALFGFFVVFPIAFEYFLGFQSEVIRIQPSMESYFGFSASLLFAFGILFELPIAIILLNFLGLVEARQLWAGWRYAIVIIMVVAALITPPDPITLFLLGIPLVALYFGTAILCTLFERARVKKGRAASRSATLSS